MEKTPLQSPNLREFATALLTMQYREFSAMGPGLLVVQNSTENEVASSSFVPADRVNQLKLKPERLKNILEVVSDYDACSQMPVLMVDNIAKQIQFELMPCGMVKLPYIGLVS